MSNSIPLLTILGVLPLAFALIAFVVRGKAGKQLALVGSLVTLAVGVWAFFAAGSGDLSELVPWIPQIGAWYALSLDGMGRAMVLLTVILVPIVLGAEWTLDQKKAEAHAEPRWGGNVFGALALLVEGFALFVFMSADVLLFYIFFEATLIPMFFLITGWGGAKRGRAAMKFLLFSLAGGLVMLFAVIGVYGITAGAGQPSFLIDDFASIPMSETVQKVLFAGFFIAFAVKAPMVPVHTWLPDTAEQALPGATALLVGILDKIGTFGMIRICLGMLPGASLWATPFVVVLAVISIIYGAVLAITSTNLLRLVAYTSVSHFGFMVLGIYVFTTQSINGSIFFMVNHGFSTAALFLTVGYLIKRRGSADITAFGGVEKLAPVLAGAVLLAVLSAVSLPGMSTFVSEFLVIAGTWSRTPWIAAIAATGIVLAATYALLMYQRTMTGPVTEATAKHFTRDLTGGERSVLIPVVTILLVFGVLPGPIVSLVEPTAKAAMERMQLSDPIAPAKGEK